MDLKSLLQPDGNPWKLLPYAFAYTFIAASASMAAAVQYHDYIWLAEEAFYAVQSPLVLFATAWLVWFATGRRLSTPVQLAIIVIFGCMAAMALQLAVADACGLGEHPGKGYLYRLAEFRGPALWWGFAAAAWYTTQRSQLHAAEMARVELAGEDLRASTAEARLQALHAQVEPHFLFNTLAHVKWLYRRDPERGRRMLDRLLDYLQAALPRVRQATTTLEEELELARAYLDIQQIRIGGRLAFTIEVPEEIAKLRFPPLMLLTLVENAIKHGIAPQTGGGTIVIRAHADANVLRIEVRDTGAGLRDAAGSGMGLANVRARLAALFGAGARLVIEPNLPTGVVAAIEIPR
jgi:signal transduction histidine kinase